MTTDVVIVPRRGTRVFRLWMLRVLTIGGLPLVAIGTGVLTVVAFEQGRGAAGQTWTELSGWLFAALVVVGAAGIVAMLDARTRLAGAFALLVALVVNPLTASLVLVLLGLG